MTDRCFNVPHLLHEQLSPAAPACTGHLPSSLLVAHRLLELLSGQSHGFIGLQC